MALVSIVRVVVRVREIAVPVLVRVVMVVLMSVRVRSPYGEAESGQADRGNTQPHLHTIQHRLLD
ncbi:MAG: hypothetical protein IPM64_00230 [Phycisphaerales bacterium]|nr:hypothetical protein [Phycisphaerales bacterium]